MSNPEPSSCVRCGGVIVSGQSIRPVGSSEGYGVDAYRHAGPTCPPPSSEPLAALGAAEPADDIPKYEIMFGWVVFAVGQHTCGMGGYGEPHEPGCGYEPVIRVERLHELLISAGILKESDDDR